MSSLRRPLADRLEVAAPGVAAVAARLVGLLPPPVRRRILHAAVSRAMNAFNRGDLDAAFALFAPDVEYLPPPPLHRGVALMGKDTVIGFWLSVRAEYDVNTVEHARIEEMARGSFACRVGLRHRSTATGERLDYEVVQTTILVGGQVKRQVNTVVEATVGR